MMEFSINGTPNQSNILNWKKEKQAGAELGQAQLQLELGFTLFAALYWWLQTQLHITEHNKSVNLVTSTYLHTSLLNC